MISALTGDGVEDLKTYLATAVPEGPWLFPEDQLSDASLRQTAAEITREKLFLRLHEELPYALTVETTEWKQLNDGSIRIEQTIYVERENQRRIVLGAKGAMIKEIGQAARTEIAEMAGVAVHLFLFVKVRDRWGEDPGRFHEMGLDYPKR
jgi:GTP-binding protein Era